MNAREQAREVARRTRGSVMASSERWALTDQIVDEVADVYESLTATARLREAGIDLARLTEALDSKEDWGHLVHAFEVLTVLGAVKAEMEAIGDE